MLVYHQWSLSLDMKLLIFYCFKKTKDCRSSMGKLVLSPLAFFMKYYFFPPTLVLSLVATFTTELGRIGHRFFFFFFRPRFVSTSWKNLVFSFSSWMWKQQFFWVEGLVRRNKRGGGIISNYFQFYVPKISLYKNYSTHFNLVFYQMGSVWEEATLVGWWLVAQNPKWFNARWWKGFVLLFFCSRK